MALFSTERLKKPVTNTVYCSLLPHPGYRSLVLTDAYLTVRDSDVFLSLGEIKQTEHLYDSCEQLCSQQSLECN